ncbi:MAG TPA: electron transport complex subunit RsxC [Lachnospiraceae bacterium]|nr:electron transport complex subunit RsxC [Lachnospiraceae bacterium]
MKRLTFTGGVHPYEGKELSKDKPITEVRPGKELVFLLSQHIGAPAKPCVAVGDRVLAGQKIAEAGSFVSAPVHSSVSGTVKAFEKRKNAVGEMAEAVIIENDGQYEKVRYNPAESLESLSKEEIINRIKEAGVVGMGGAGFPTHVKLSPKEPDKLDYVLVNGSECEPYLTSDYRRMIENPEWIIAGLKCILRLFDNAKGYICIEDNKPDAISRMQSLTANEKRIEVKTVMTKYPEGAERCLINAVTGRKVNSSMLPADAGCVVDNIDTVVAVYKAVMLGQPLTERIFTVSGDAVKDPRNLSVKVGTSYNELIEPAGGFIGKPEKMISGGPMMGFALYGLDVPVTKTSGALTCFLHDDVSKEKETACISCARCVNGCPARLMPCKLATFAEHHDTEKFLEYYGMECVECGSCSFQCPAKRPLAADIKSMRRTILANRKKKR